MKPKSLLALVLLTFVAASIVGLAVRSLRQQPPQQAEAETTAAGAAAETEARTISDGVIVYYFHGKVRCPTCRKIEAYAHEAVEIAFGPQLKSGDLQWKVVNYEAAGQEHFAEDYNIIAPTVVLVQMRHGAQQQWKNLDLVWELVFSGDKQSFLEYVQEETRALLRGSAS
jgi:hypothetical protein